MTAHPQPTPPATRTDDATSGGALKVLLAVLGLAMGIAGIVMISREEAAYASSLDSDASSFGAQSIAGVMVILFGLGVLFALGFMAIAKEEREYERRQAEKRASQFVPAQTR